MRVSGDFPMYLRSDKEDTQKSSCPSAANLFYVVLFNFTYVSSSPKGRGEKKPTGIENSCSTLNSEFVENIGCFVHDS